MTDSTLVGIRHIKESLPGPWLSAQAALAFMATARRPLFVWRQRATYSGVILPCRTRADGAKTSRQRLQVVGQGPLPQFSNRVAVVTVIAAAAVVAVVFCGGIRLHSARATARTPISRLSSSLKPQMPPRSPLQKHGRLATSQCRICWFLKPRVLSRGTEILLCEYRSAPSAVVGGFPNPTALVLRQAQGLDTGRRLARWLC